MHLLFSNIIPRSILSVVLLCCFCHNDCNVGAVQSRGLLRSWTLKATLHVKVNLEKPAFLSSFQAMTIVFSAGLQISYRDMEECFVWESPIYKPHVEPWRSILCGKFLFTNPMSSHGGAFRVGNSIYKLILRLGGAFCVGNSYLQTHFAAWRSVLCGEFLFIN